jgi:hypothetical protein
MACNIRAVLSLESSFFHPPCQATSYAADDDTNRLHASILMAGRHQEAA